MADWFIRAFGAAIADVRDKLVSEAWFGRAELPDPTPFPGESFDEKMIASPQWQRDFLDWGKPNDARAAGSEPPDHRQAQQQDIGIDH